MKKIKYHSMIVAALAAGTLLTQPASADIPSSSKVLGLTVIGTTGPDNLWATGGNDRILSGGISQGAEAIAGNGGSDRLELAKNDGIVANNAGNNNGHTRVRDFIIDNIHTNPEADHFSIGRFIDRNDLDETNIGDYLHIVSGIYGPASSGVFINLEGDFSASDRAQLDNGVVGPYGADLFFEFQGRQGTNNFELITGHPDNSIQQLKALIDLGFLELSTTDFYGSSDGDNLEGAATDDRLFSVGTLRHVESIRGNGGADQLVFQHGDSFNADTASNDTAGHFRIRDFTIDDIQLNPEADSVSLGSYLGAYNLDASALQQYIHIRSATFEVNRTVIYVNLEGDFTSEQRAALDADQSFKPSGAEIFLEFQGQVADNNLENLTGFADNSLQQIQTLIDWGFLNTSE